MTAQLPSHSEAIDRQAGSAFREPTLRLFVALELPDTWKQALHALQDESQASLAAHPETKAVRVRWVRPEGIHLTLKFLGQVPQERLEKIDWALRNAVAEPPRFDLTLGRAGSFSDRRAPRVIWAGITEPTSFGPRGILDTKLYQLAEAIETWFAAAGFPRERRSFAPHLTLARLPEDLSPQLREAVAAITNASPAPRVSPFMVERVSLMRSQLSPGGARYERLAAYPDQPLQPDEEQV
jgi:2'-5' RNA ligase